MPYLLNTMDYTYRERHEEATYRFKDGLLPSDLFHRQVFLSFQEDAVGIRLRDIIGVDNIMWGSDYPHSESTFPDPGKCWTRFSPQVPQEERAKIVDTMLPGSITSTSSALSPRPADPSGQSSAGARDAATPTSLITETAHASCIRQARSYGIITLSRPEARNAWGDDFNEGIARYFADMEDDDDIRCVVLTGDDQVGPSRRVLTWKIPIRIRSVPPQSSLRAFPSARTVPLKYSRTSPSRSSAPSMAMP